MRCCADASPELFCFRIKLNVGFITLTIRDIAVTPLPLFQPDITDHQCTVKRQLSVGHKGHPGDFICGQRGFMPVFITLHKDGITLVVQPYLFRKAVIAQIFCADLPELASAVFINGDDGLLSAAVGTENTHQDTGLVVGVETPHSDSAVVRDITGRAEGRKVRLNRAGAEQ